MGQVAELTLALQRNQLLQELSLAQTTAAVAFGQGTPKQIQLCYQ